MGRHWHRWRDRREVPIPEVGSWAGPSPRWHNRLSLDQLWCWGGVGLLDYRDAEAKWHPKGEGLPGPLRESGRWERTGPQEANNREAAATKAPRETQCSQAAPGRWSPLGHQPTEPLPWGLRVKEQFFWFRMRWTKIFMVSTPRWHGDVGLRCRGPLSSDGSRQGML